MNDLRLYIIHDTPQTEINRAVELKAQLDNNISARNLDLDNTPEIELRAGFENLPDLDEIGPLSLVLLVLPDTERRFTDEEQRRITSFRSRCGEDDIRLVPVALEPARNQPPTPIDDLVAFKLHDIHDSNLIERLATLALNLLCLRVASSRRSVFISYKASDGKLWAEGIARGLQQRGYTVWRDENLDRDGQAQIAVGSSAQKTIQEAILQHGFVLVLDTLEAPKSMWVGEEISTAISYMLPVMPVVIEDITGVERQRPKCGGRFHALRELQHEVRITYNDLQAHGLPNDTNSGAANDDFFDKLEKALNDQLLEHLQSCRRLLRATQSRFQALSFNWTPVAEHQLLYQAVGKRDTDMTPGLCLRFLVQCAPYDILSDNCVPNLCEHYKQQIEPHQYCILVHETGLYVADKQRLLSNCGGNVMLLQPDEIDRLPAIFHFDSGDAQ